MRPNVAVDDSAGVHGGDRGQALMNDKRSGSLVPRGGLLLLWTLVHVARMLCTTHLKCIFKGPSFFEFKH